jgi:pyroglutamyl-peptidase
VFGFEPFLEFDENPSGLIASRLDGKIIYGQNVVSKILHVDYSLVESEISAAISATRPLLVVGFGLAANRTKVTPEKIAINYRYSNEPDNTGKNIGGAPIAAGGPDGLFTNLPVEGLVDHLNKEGVPSSLSTTGGAYLCNNAMFCIVKEARNKGFGGGFIHVPCHSEWVARKNKSYASLPIETLIKAAELSLAYCLDELRHLVVQPGVNPKV